MKIVYQMVETFDTDFVQVGDGDAIRFRLEVFNSKLDGRLFGRVFRLDTYRIQPAFPLFDGAPTEAAADAEIFVIDDSFSSDDLCGDSVEDVVAKFEEKLALIFG